ncbi:hypothetical protein HN385_07695 [archaeon]|jgi:hypothetical protein|nr:hypothetical protein [archaeon]MBT7558628.1 hypothetical protein [Candidatus Woesearchaeota archaeon]
MIKLKYLLTENLDTEIEMLKKYMKAGGERTTKIDSTIKSLYSKKSKYSKELNPISGEVYRGTAISKKDLKKLKIAKRDDKWLFLKMKYRSRRPVQSFTYNFDLAQKFAKYNAKPDYPESIIITKIDNNFVGNYKWLGKIGKEVGLKRNEQEVFHVGNTMNVLVKVNALAVYGLFWEKELELMGIK